MSESSIEAVLHEDRRFAPPTGFAAKAKLTLEQYQSMYRQSLDDPEAFWGGVANELH